MKHLITLVLYLFSPLLGSARAETCAIDETPVKLILKESFRYSPDQRDGTHRYFWLVGCSALENESLSRVRGTVHIGKEADADYSQITPKPLPGTESALPFNGIYQDAKIPAHGSATEIRSDDGNVKVEGNFYYNRDISFSVGNKVVPATKIQ